MEAPARDTLDILLIQTSQAQSKADNLDAAFDLLRRACAEAQTDLAVLPEMFPFYSADPKAMIKSTEAVPDGPLYRQLGAMAKELGIFLHAGSILEEGPEGRFNTSFVFNPQGAEIARYRKIHCFDITAPDGTIYRESDVFKAGDKIVTYDAKGFKLGCAICYDLRFSELFLALQEEGVDAIVLPAAFTRQTGRDHWQVLLRARAIETQAYLLAAAQTGDYDNATRATYGHSLVVGPWGQIIADAGEETGYVRAKLSADDIDKVRARIPMRAHRRIRGF